MTGRATDPVIPLNPVTENEDDQNNSPSLQDQILSHIASLETLIKQHNERTGTPIVTPIYLNFNEDRDGNKWKDDRQGPRDEDLKKSYKEVMKSSFARRIIEFSAPSHRMPTNLKIYDGSTNPDDHITRFVGAANQREWIKDPIEVSKIVRVANETLPDFKERWTEEISYIQSVPEVMQISAFMGNAKCLELARRFADQVPQTVTESMKRVDDFVKFEDAYKSTELSKEEHLEKGQGTSYRGSRTPRPGHRCGHQRMDNYNTYNPKKAIRGSLRIQKVQSLSQGWRRPQAQVPKKLRRLDTPITFPPIPADDVSDEPLIIEAEVEGYLVRRVFVDQGAVVQVIEQLIPMGKIELSVMFGSEGLSRRTMMKFTMVRASSSYNIISGRTDMKELRAISSTTHAMMKFPIPKGIAILVAGTAAVFECHQLEEKHVVPKRGLDEEILKDKKEPTEEEVLVNHAFLEQKATIGMQFSPACRLQLMNLLKDNKDVFAWQPSDMIGVSRRIIQHSLNVNLSITPVAQKRKVLGPEKSKAVTKEVEEWVKAGIMRSVWYPTWISNPVLVKKVDSSWRMCIDFKNVDSACPNDYYLLPEIDLKIEVVMGFPFKCFLDAYKGYHHIQMFKEDEEKTAFYTDQGTYCYTKMSFGLKNAGATYQRLVDSAL
ncbi:hypothetical protein Tco_1153197 [Tanacetum coccineum]